MGAFSIILLLLCGVLFAGLAIGLGKVFSVKTYNPEKGEPLQNIAPGIGFDALPPNWLCPVCSAEKTLFAME